MTLIPKKELKTFVDLLNTVVLEARLHISKEGLYARTVDTANVALVECTLPMSLFPTSTYGEHGLPVKAMKKAILDIAGEYIDITFAGGYIILSDVETRVRIKEINEVSIRVDPKPPELEHTTRFHIHGPHIATALQKCSKYGDVLAVKYEKVATFSTRNNEETETAIRVSCPVEEIRNDTPEVKCHRVLLSNDYMRDTAPILRRSAVVEVGIRTDFPIIITGVANNVQYKYMLAPRIEDSSSYGEGDD